MPMTRSFDEVNQTARALLPLPSVGLSTAAATALMLALSMILPASPAFAGHGAQANSGTPDDRNHYIDRNSLTAKSDSATVQGVSQLNRTVMNATFSGSGDVEVYDDYYGTGGDWQSVSGKVTCMGYTPLYTHCDLYLMQYNLTYVAGYSQSQADQVGCHELGHTAGLGHRTSATDTDNNSCMRSGLSTWRYFDQHDIDAVNSTN